jgi:hypothetical protein
MLNQRIIIENSTTTLQRAYRTQTGKQSFRKYKEMSTSSFFNNFATAPFVLPQNTRYHNCYDNTHLFVTEYEPQMRTINICINMKSKWDSFRNWCERNKVKNGIKFFKGYGSKEYREHRFQLFFPYLIMVSAINQRHRWGIAYMFMSQRSLVNMASMLYKIPMYNTRRDQSSCFSSSFPDAVYRVPIPDAVDLLFKSYFNGRFNSDYNYNMVSYARNPVFNNYFVWAYLSEIDPFKIFKVKLIRYKNLEGIITQIQQRLSLQNTSDVARLAQMF